MPGTPSTYAALTFKPPIELPSGQGVTFSANVVYGGSTLTNTSDNTGTFTYPTTVNFDTSGPWLPPASARIIKLSRPRATKKLMELVVEDIIRKAYPDYQPGS